MSTYRQDSMYRNTPIIDEKYLDIYNSPVIDKNADVQTIEISSKYHQRPDVLAFDLYGNAKLWWVFAEYNQDSLIDPIVDFTSGKKITVPLRFS